MPIGSVYQPEVAARTISLPLCTTVMRSLVGFPIYKAIVGNKVAPWYADWVLSRQGIKGLQTDDRAETYRNNNLWYSVGEDRGAYGDFKDVAANKSITLWMSMHRGLAWRACPYNNKTDNHHIVIDFERVAANGRTLIFSD